MKYLILITALILVTGCSVIIDKQDFVLISETQEIQMVRV